VPVQLTVSIPCCEGSLFVLPCSRCVVIICCLSILVRFVPAAMLRHQYNMGLEDESFWLSQPFHRVNGDQNSPDNDWKVTFALSNSSWNPSCITTWSFVLWQHCKIEALEQCTSQIGIPATGVDVGGYSPQQLPNPSPSQAPHAAPAVVAIVPVFPWASLYHAGERGRLVALVFFGSWFFGLWQISRKKGLS